MHASCEPLHQVIATTKKVRAGFSGQLTNVRRHMSEMDSDIKSGSCRSLFRWFLFIVRCQKKYLAQRAALWMTGDKAGGRYDSTAAG